MKPTIRTYGGTLEVVKPGNPRGRSDETRAVWFRGTTEAVDSHGSVIKADGLDFTRFRKNPTILLDHRNEVSAIAGKAVGIEAVVGATKGFDIGVAFASKESDEAARAERLARGGFLQGMSIGFMPIEERFGPDVPDEERRELGLPDSGFVVDRAEVHHFALVGVGSNDEALQRALTTGVITREDADFLEESCVPPASEGGDPAPSVRELVLQGNQELRAAFDDLTATFMGELDGRIGAIANAVLRIQEMLGEPARLVTEADIMDVPLGGLRQLQEAIAARTERIDRAARGNGRPDGSNERATVTDKGTHDA